MGRGRAKAKQTKVARELKYHSPNTDYAALQRELAGSGTKPREELEAYDEYLGEDSDEEDDEDESDNDSFAPGRSR